MADHDATADTASRSMSLNIPLNKKKKLGGPMNVEELKMNKMLLKEIHAAKKLDKEQSQASKSPKRSWIKIMNVILEIFDRNLLICF